MRYWYDCEFIESGSTEPIDLISIGIVAEDGREFYAISTEFDESKANQWVKDNVVSQLPKQANWYEERGLEPPIECFRWMSRETIKNMVFLMLDAESELWGYYSAYDHVVLCQLFGTMAGLPERFPMYTRDIKQWCDSLGNPKLPKQGKGTHNALEDARWNKQAWEFLNNLSEGAIA